MKTNAQSRIMQCVAIVFAIVATVNARTLTIDVPVAPGAELGSRPASFIWSIASANGAEPLVGQFACGSYWVAPAAGDSGVRVVSLSGSSGGIPQPNHVSLDADPIVERRGLLNNKNNYGNYNANEALMSALPKVFTPSSGSAISLVAALQRNETEASGGGTSAIMGERVDAYCVVTVLPTAPVNLGRDSIRPNITGASKEFLTWADFDLSRLGQFDALSELTSAQIQTIAARWRHSTEIFAFDVFSSGIVRGFSEGGRAFRASLCHDEYAAGMSAALQSDIFALFNTKNSIDEKKPALASLLAFALDLYHARYNVGSDAPKVFNSGAGQCAGKYTPTLLLAALSKNPAKASKLRELSVTNHHSSDALLRGPQEIRQIRRGVTGVVLWGDAFPYTFSDTKSMPNGSPSRRYWTDLLEARNYLGQTPYGNANVGKKTAGDPYGYIDGPPNYPGYAYMAIGASATKGLAAMMILMPTVRDIVNSDLPIEFADRVHRHGTWAAPDPIAPPPPGILENTWSPGVFPTATFGVTWGPRVDDVRFGIESATGTGRFNPSDKHNKDLPLAFEAGLPRNHWDAIIALYDGDRYEDNFVPVTGTAKPDIVALNGQVHITHPHPLAKIYYTTDGSTPSPSSKLYTGPFTADAAAVKTMATTPGKTNSAVRTRYKTAQSVTPPANALIQVY